MNKHINFEDTIFILNVRIRMIRDLMQLDTDSAVFLAQTMTDLEFINKVMGILSEKFLANIKLLEREAEAENILDAEWKFTQVLNEIFNKSSIFSPAKYPEMAALITKLRQDSTSRQKQIEESCVPSEHSKNEPVVSSAELNGLLAINMIVL